MHGDGERWCSFGAQNNVRLFQRVTLVSSQAGMNGLFTAVQQVNLREVAATQRPSMAQKVRFAISITFYLDKLMGAGLIGGGRIDLPDYMRDNRFMVGMEKNNRRVFEDNLCFLGV